MITLLLSCLVISLAIFYYYCMVCRHARFLNRIPGPRILPFFGNTYLVLGDNEQLWNVARYLNNTYYPIWRFWSLTTPMVNIRHPDDIEIVLSSNKHIEKSLYYDFLHPWFQTGLLTSTGAKWQTRRKILTPAFHFNILQQFMHVLADEAEEMVAYLHSTDEVVNLLDLTTEFTLNAICETAMGTSLRGRGTFQSKYRKAVQDMSSSVVYRLMRPWLYNNFTFGFTRHGRIQTRSLKILHNFTEKIIQERKQYHDETDNKYLKGIEKEETNIDDEDDSALTSVRKKKRLAMLDLLISASRNGNQIDDAGIREEVDTFMFEGHDTTAAGMCFLFLLMAEHKEYQEKARMEVNELLKETDGKITMSVLQRLSYVDRCVKEALRLYPSVPFIARKINEDLKLTNYTLPAGIYVHLHIFDIHRDPNFWSNPNVFDPDRFLPERTLGRHPFSYVPFSAGPRNCIGQRFATMELKAMLALVLHNFYLEPVDRLKDIKLISDLVIRPAHTVRLRFIPIR